MAKKLSVVRDGTAEWWAEPPARVEVRDAIQAAIAVAKEQAVMETIAWLARNVPEVAAAIDRLKSVEPTDKETN